MSETHPQAIDGLEISIVEDGAVVHDSRHDKIHYLNPTAAAILELCNGRVAAAELPELLRLAYGLSEAPVDDVKSCVAALRREGLLL
jgi:hypothetical protein